MPEFAVRQGSCRDPSMTERRCCCASALPIAPGEAEDFREVKVASEPEALLAVLKNPLLPLQADWIGSRAIVAVALERSRRSRVTGGLCRDAAYAGGAEGADQQDGPQRCARHGAELSARREAHVAETRKLAAILAADVVGYSRLAGADEGRTLARLSAATLRPCL